MPPVSANASVNSVVKPAGECDAPAGATRSRHRCQPMGKTRDELVMWLRSLAPEAPVQIAVVACRSRFPPTHSVSVFSLGLPPSGAFLTSSCFEAARSAFAERVERPPRGRARAVCASPSLASARPSQSSQSPPSLAIACAIEAPGVRERPVGERRIRLAFQGVGRPRRPPLGAAGIACGDCGLAAIERRGRLAQVAVAGQGDEREHGERGDDRDQTRLASSRRASTDPVDVPRPPAGGLLRT